MTSARLPYVRRKRKLLFWTPSPAMRAKGFLPLALGPESAETIAQARGLYEAWLKANAGGGRRVTSHPAGSLGHFFDAQKLTAKWAKKAPRTRDDYERAWRHLAPIAGVTLTRISAEDCERLADRIEADHGAHERYRAIKCLRALLADAIVRLRLVGYPNPAKGFANPQPRGRSAIWLGAEVVKLAATAEAAHFNGIAIALRVAWDTLFSPVDVWNARLGDIQRDGDGAFIVHRRAKTGKQAFGHLTAATETAIKIYVESLGFDLTPESPFIRQRNGNAYRSKDTFSADFRDVRNIAFPGDTRQFQDLRRSGNVEADAAGASKGDMAEILANTMDRSRFLDETYTPPTVAKARDVARLRLEGRRKLAGEIIRAHKGR